MRILLIHNFYQGFGGEDAVALAERQLLENYGNDVFSYTRHNNEIKRYDLRDKLGLIFHTIYSRRTEREISNIVWTWKPEVAYIHNIYPLISPSVYHTLWSLKIPMIQVVHNFRPFCPNGWFFTRGRVCERCKWGNYFHAIRHRCYRNSYLTSTLYSATMGINRLADMVRRIDAFVCLTPFARDKLLGLGIPHSKVFVKPNWVETTMDPGLSRGNYVAYLGRLSSEKGLWTLVRAFERLDSVILKIAGTGPLEAGLKAYLQRKAIKNVMMVGFKGGEEKWDLLANSRFIVVPSEWYENFPLVVLEAYAAGKPVVGSKLGSLPYIIEENKSGILFEPGCVDDLVKKVSYLLGRPDEVDRMGRYARSLVESAYSPAACYQRLMGIFSSVRGNGDYRSTEPGC
ncbi:MAG: glycosyltransferase family 4 protein [Acidobacteriia bacterium]|nr:glycosyltransferase family 4 protein [Terriglobia bacterium]